jgi:nucleoid-associated protein YgaU
MMHLPDSAPAAGRPDVGPAWNRVTLLAWMVASLLIVLRVAPAWGQQSGSHFPITDEQKKTAEQVSQAGVALSELAPGAPERYTIKRGDTLWAISVLYLKSPWRWPELWGMNRQQIANPHLIYPGQMLVLVRTPEGRAVLKLAGTEGTMTPISAPAPAPAPAAPAPPPLPTERLAPRVRDLGDVGSEPIPSIPNRLIEPFLSQPIIIAAGELAKYPRIVATPEDRVYLGRGDLAYARGIEDQSQTDFHVFRPARPLYDPDNPGSHEPIAYEAFFLGSARVTKRGEVTTLKILDSRREIGVEDRLLPIEHEALVTYAPHHPARPIQGRLISVYGSIDDAGPQSIVTLNRGIRDGLDIGTVLAVDRSGQTVRDRTVSGSEFVKLPDERIGHMFVFRVFDGISYALVMTATGPIKVGDRFGLPDQMDDGSSADGGLVPSPSPSAAVAAAH